MNKPIHSTIQKGHSYELAFFASVKQKLRNSSVTPLHYPKEIRYTWLQTDMPIRMAESAKKKLKTKNFKHLLTGMQLLSMQHQKKHLEDFAETWRGGREQLDDILVIGIRL